MSLNNSPFHYLQSTFSRPSQQLLGILLSLLPFIRNLPPSAILTLVSLSGNHWSFGRSCYPAYLCYLLDVRGSRALKSCRYARDETVIPIYVLCGVSLLTMTAIRMDRHLAMSLELRCKEIVTLRRTYLISAIVWIVCLLARLRSHSSSCSNIRLCTTRCT